VLTELGYSYHTISHDITPSNSPLTTKISGRVSFGQLVWNLGVFF
jgi:hypothetical protein